MGSVYQRGGVWWVAYYHQGVQRRESSGSTKRPVAVALLKRRHEELGKGRPAREASTGSGHGGTGMVRAERLRGGSGRASSRPASERRGESPICAGSTFG